jgi:hypothetical protein
MAEALYTQFDGGWCDNCRIAAAAKACPDCGQPMRPARIEVVPKDAGQAELLRRVRDAMATEPSGDTWQARVAVAVRRSYPGNDRPGLIEIRDAEE